MKTLSKLNYFQLITMSLVMIFSSGALPNEAKADTESYLVAMTSLFTSPEVIERSPLVTRWVRLTENLNVRTKAGIAEPIIQVAPKDSVAMIVGNPEEAGGYIWYKVKFPGGPQGWIASGYTILLPSLAAPAGASVVSSFGGISVASVKSIGIEVDLPNKKSVVTLSVGSNAYSKSFDATTTTQILALVAGEMGVSAVSLSIIPKTVSIIPDVVDGIHVFAEKSKVEVLGAQRWDWSVDVSYISDNKEVYSSGTPFEDSIVAEKFFGNWEEYYKQLNEYINAWKKNLVADYFGTGKPLPAKDALIAIVARTFSVTMEEAEEIMTYDIDKKVDSGEGDGGGYTGG